MKHFDADEFVCPCEDCTLATTRMSPVLLAMLDDARGYAVTPFVLPSAFRCKEYNAFKRFSPTSSHLVGMAVDIATPNSNVRMLVLMGLVKAGFRRIGIRKDFIHADCDPIKDHMVAWLY